MSDDVAEPKVFTVADFKKYLSNNPNLSDTSPLAVTIVMPEDDEEVTENENTDDDDDDDDDDSNITVDVIDLETLKAEDGTDYLSVVCEFPIADEDEDEEEEPVDN